MRNVLLTLLFISLSISCTEIYDDSQAWKDIDNIYKELDQLKEKLDGLQVQVNALSQIINGGAITSITELEGGGYRVYYKGLDNVEQSFVIATQDQMTTLPIISIEKVDNIFYWTTMAGGKTEFLLDENNNRIPITGKIPQIRVDAEGYWVINGNRILDSNQKPVKAGGGTSTSLINDVVVNSDGTASITLSNGEMVKVSAFNLFNVQFSLNGIPVAGSVEVEEGTTSMKLGYQIVGTKADQAILIVTRSNGLTASLNSNEKELQISFPDDFEVGSVMLLLYDTESNLLVKPLRFIVPIAGEGGISSAADFMEFINAVNTGGSLRKFRNSSGDVVLLQDIDMSGYPLTSGIGDPVTVNTTSANSNVVYTMGANTFNGLFDGQGHRIYNLVCSYDVADGNKAHGLFNALGAAGVVKNLTVAGKVTVTGVAPQGAAVGGLVGYSEGTLLACTNRLDIAFEGSDANNITVRIGGLVGVLNMGSIGDGTPANGCVNEGNLTCGTIANEGSGANGAFHQAGIVAFMQGEGALVSHAINRGDLSAPSGRSGGIAGTMNHGKIEYCVNDGTIQDDINNIFASHPSRYNIKRMGGIVGGSNSNTYVNHCTNNGSLFSQNGCRTGGFVGHNGGYVQSCTNNGIILSDYIEVGSARHGAGWACGYSGSSDEFVTDCHIGGKVGDYSLYKDNIEATPSALYSNAVCHGAFSPEKNNFSNQDEAFYDWKVVEETELATGVVLKHFSFTNFSQNIYALEIDLTNPKVTFETVMADEICPNPNANNNSNNGKNLRETLSETAERRRSEGRNIVAGINTGFFNSHDGFPRGMHIEEGEPVFVNNPDVRESLVNHRPGFTFFEDRTISFEYRYFRGNLKVDGVEYEYYSINDTIVRLNGSHSYDANLYTHRFVREPHPGINNPVGEKALFIVGHNSSPLKMNHGYMEATITQIIDGRTASVEVPYVTGKDEWVLQVTGAKAEELAGKLHAGKSVEIMAELRIGNSTDRIKVHNSSMYRYLYNGVYAAPSASVAEVIDPTTNLGVNQERTRMVIFCVDGRSSKDRGLNFYEAYRVAKKLGLHDVIRFDGGGSTTMWAYSGGTGKVVNTVSDSKGERSCMNYLHVRVLE
jgi:exopolysaccharide biosynthesis protein